MEAEHRGEESPILAEVLPSGEEQFRVLFQTAVHGILFLDARGRILSANRAAERILGLSLEQMLGKGSQAPRWECIHEDGTPFRGEALPAMVALRTGRPVEDVAMGVLDSATGRQRWLHVSAVPLFHEGERQPFQVCVTFVEISERKRLEETQLFLAKAEWLAAGEDFFHALARFLARHLEMDFACIDRLSADGVGAETLAVWRHGGFEDNFTYALNGTPCGAVVQLGTCCVPDGVLQRYPEAQMLRDLGAECCAGVILRSVEGRSIGLIAVIGSRPMADHALVEATLSLVAARAASELELRQASEVRHLSDARLEQAFGASPIGMALVDLDGTMLRANAMFCAMVGWTEPELLSRNFQSLTHPDDLAADLRHRQALLDGTARTYQMEKRYLHRDGHEVWVQLNVSLVRDARGVPLHFVSQVQDISGRKQAEHQRAMTLEILDILNRIEDPAEATRLILRTVRQELGIEAVAIRLAGNGDFTYTAHEGFPETFIQAENCLRARTEAGEPLFDEAGNPLFECTCGLVLTGRTDPSNPLFTPLGSAWTSDALPFLEVPPQDDPRLHPRNRCIHAGYRSVALVPIRARDQIIGLLQLNDPRPNRITLDLVTYLEGITATIGLALTRKQVREQLEASLTHLHLAHEAARTGSWEWDLRSGGHTWSREFQELVGLEPGRLPPSQDLWLSLLHPDDRARVEDELHERTAQGADLEFEWRRLHTDGRVRWILTRGHALRDAGGAVSRYLGIAMDITDRKQAEAALRESEEKFARAFRDAPMLMSITELETGVFLDVNEAYLRSSGFTRAEVIGHTSVELGWIHGSDRARLLYELQRSGRITSMELELHGKGGRLVHCLYSGERVTIGGRPVLLSTAQDITERKRAEASLQLSGERYRKLFDEAVEGIALLDPERDVIVDCNQAFLRLTGMGRGHVTGASLAAFHPAPGLHAFRARLQVVVQGDASSEFLSTNLLTQSGLEKAVELKVNRIELGGRWLALCLFKDLTEERRRDLERDATVRLLQLLNQPTDMRGLLDGLTGFLQEWSGCETVGIQLRDGHASDPLCKELQGIHPDLPGFTPQGSFWTNSTTDLLAGPDGRIASQYREEGYESVAILPLRSGGRSLGLLQLKDPRKGCFTPEGIAFLEGIGDQAALALAKRQTQDALEHSERRFRSLSEAAGEFLWETDATGNLTFISDRIRDILGYEPSEMIGRHPFEFMPAEEVARLKGLSPEELDFRNREVPMRAASGRIVWTRSTRVAKYDSQGVRTGFLGASLDITERRRMEEALLASEGRLRLAAEATGFGVYSRDFATGERYYSPEFLQLYGLDPRQAIELDEDQVPRALHAGDKAHFLARLADSMDPEGNGVLDAEYRVQLPGGQHRWLRILGRTVFSGKVPARANGIVQDITSRKEAELALTAANERLALAQRASHSGAWGWDMASGQLQWSPEMFELFGLPTSGLEPTFDLWRSLVHPADREDAEARITVSIHERIPLFNEYRIIDPAGATRFIQAFGDTQYDSAGSPLRMSGLCIDVTELRKAEEGQRASDARFAQLFRNMNEGLARCRMLFESGRPVDWVYLDVNPAFDRLVGLGDVVGKRVTELIPGIRETNPDLFEIYGRVAQKGIPESFETYVPGLDKWFFVSVFSPDQGLFVATFQVVTERKRAEAALRESETRVRAKLNAVLAPEGDLGTLELADIIDAPVIQELMDHFHALTKIGIGIIDLNGRVLVGTGWQDICTQYHRTHPEACQNCLESDLFLSSGTEPGAFKMYKCKNNLWDIATPIHVGGRHVGNLFLGQFFFEDEVPDLEVFRAQAQRFGFDPSSYLAALERIPRWKRETVDAAMGFYARFSNLISDLSYGRLKLARTLEERGRAQAIMQLRVRLMERSLTQSMKHLLIAAVDEAEALTGSQVGFFHFVEPDQQTLSLQAWSTRTTREMCLAEGDGRHYDIAEAGVWVDCIRQRQAVIHNDYAALPHRKGLPEGHAPVLREVVVPVFRAGSIVAVLGVGNKEEEYDQADVESLALLADLAWDIAEQRRVRDALDESRETFSKAFHQSPILASITTLAEGVFLDVNEEFCRLLEWDRSEVIGRSSASLELWADAAIREHILAEIRAQGFVRNQEVQVRAKSGQTRMVLWSAELISVRDQPCLLASAMDISRQKAMSMELQRSQRLLQQVLDTLPIPVFGKDLEGRYFMCNRAFPEFLGRPEDEVLGKTAFDIAPPHLAATYLRADEQLLETRETQQYEAAMMSAAGPREVLFKKNVMRNAEGEVTGLVGALLDITERKQAERLLRANETKLDLALQSARMGVWTWDMADGTRQFDQQVFRTLSIEADSFIGPQQDFLDMVMPEDRETVRAAWVRMVEGNQPYEVEYRVRWRDDSVHIIHSRGRLMRDASGGPARVTGILWDVTEQRKVEIALKTSEEQYRRLFDTMKEGFALHEIITDEEGRPIDYRYLDVNPAFEALTGLPRTAWIGHTIREIMPETDSFWIETYGRVALTGEPARLENHFAPLGRWYQVFAYRPAPRQFAVLAADITDRKLAEQALLDSLQRNRALVNANPDMMFVFSADGRFLDAKTEHGDGLYTPREDFLGKHLGEVLPPEVAQQTLDRIAEAKRTGQLVQYTYTLHPHGEPNHYESRLVPCEDGTFLAVIRDITERKRLESALEKRILALTSPLGDTGSITFEDLFNLTDIQHLQDEFARATGVASIITHPNGTPLTEPSNFTILCSEIIRKTEKGRLNCFRSDAVLGRNSLDGPVVQPCLSGGLWDAGASITVGGHHIANWLIGQVRDEAQTPERMLAYAREIGADETAFMKAFQAVPAMPRERFQQIASALFTLANQLSTSAYQNIQQARFITERKAAEAEVRRLAEELEQRVKDRTAQLEAANQELEAFSYSVSHDLRSPLRGIDGFSQALCEEYQEQMDETGRHYLDRIRAGTQRMGQLIDDLLKLSRINRSGLDRVEIDLSALCRKVADDLVRAHPGRNVELSIQEGMSAQADRRLLLVVLENLLGNAWKFTSKRDAARIEVREASSPEGERIYTVQDNGAGFDMAYVSKLFSAFQRLHAASEFEGTGIGLAIVQRIIHRHGGRIWAEAAPDMGASFHFTLSDRGDA